jgi:hypothetical protein
MKSLNSIRQDPVKSHPKIFRKRIDGGGEWFIAECRRGHGEGMRQKEVPRQCHAVRCSLPVGYKTRMIRRGRVLADRTEADAITAVWHVAFMMAACGRVDLRNKNDKFIALDLDTDNPYLNQKNIRKTAREQMINGSQWKSKCCLNNSLLLCFQSMTHSIWRNFVCSCSENVIFTRQLK